MKNDLKKLFAVLDVEYVIDLPKIKTKYKVYMSGYGGRWREPINYADFGDFTVEELGPYNTLIEDRFTITPNFDPTMYGQKYVKMFARKFYTADDAKRFIVKNCHGVR